ncbi:hypothetical protein OsJ_32724 [Oryza sativa Japonica Group]|uniref:Uncharacterized protein n=1 Tax=Oryza sativa subsp. japonica TaxID=39947 RepID=A3C7Z9_ORYSJ|nr:hypothetical protein OsJ_32724 [Oryza sativa Japonica Group]
MRRLGDVVEAPALVLTPASMQQAGGRGSSGALDASMVVILAALLCVVICALGLTSLIRCALHCARGLSPTTATPTPSVSTAATAGLKKTELRRIPVEVYGAKQARRPRRRVRHLPGRLRRRRQGHGQNEYYDACTSQISFLGICRISNFLPHLKFPSLESAASTEVAEAQ